MDADFKCSLGEDDVKRAKKELNEDPRNRLGAVIYKEIEGMDRGTATFKVPSLVS